MHATDEAAADSVAAVDPPSLDDVAMQSMEPPSSWDHMRLNAWLKEQSCLNLIGIETLESLLMLELDGQTLLKVTTDDLRHSEELGFTEEEIRAVMLVQAKLEALEVRICTGTPPPPPAHPCSAPAAPTTAAAAATYVDAESGDWVVPAVCVDAAGDSYFSEKRVHVGAPAGGGRDIGALSRALPAASVTFRVTPRDYDFDLHCAPRRQFIVSLDAGVDIETTRAPGERRVFPPGTVMFVEDTWGKGHRSRAVDGKARHSVFIAVPDDVLTS